MTNSPTCARIQRTATDRQPAGLTPERDFSCPNHGEDMQKPPATQRDGEEVFSAEDLCSYAKISFDTLQRYRKDGRGPPEMRVGANLRFFKSDVIRWLAELRGTGGQE